MSKWGRIAALVAGMTSAALPARALDNVVIRTPGANEEIAALIERASLTLQAKTEADRDDTRVEATEAIAAAQGEYRQLTGALYSEGYYSGTVSVLVDGREAADIPLVNPPDRVRQVVIEVRPGRQFRFSQAAVTPPAPETELPDGYTPGEIARSGLIQDAASASATGWRNAGHAKVVLSEERITADHRNAQLASDLRFDPGPRLRFGELRVSGNKRVRTERIVEIAGLPTGEVYDPEELSNAADRLRRTGAFRAVTLSDAEEIGPGDQLAIEAEIGEERRRRLGTGIELSSTEGIAFTAFWMHRNLFGGAENLRFDLDVENIGTTADDNGIDYSFIGTFRRPATPVTDVDTFFVAGIEVEDDPGFTSERFLIGGGVTWYVNNDLEVSAGVTLRSDRVEDAFGERDYELLIFPLRATYDTRDNELDATQGVFLFGEAQPFTGVRGIENGSRFFLDGRTYLGFGEERDVVLAGRLQLGSLVGPEIDDAPPDFLFFAGGGGTVRGQPFESLGSGEVDDQIVGGRSFVGLSGEVRAYVRGPLGLVGFYDAGYIGEEEFFDGSGEWIFGAGLGARYDTGFGPIRVDVGVPVDGPDDADPVQLYIGIGQAF